MLPFAVHVLCVVPARLGSTRLPRKPLRLLAGEPLVRLVARRVLELDLGPVVVAADDCQVLEAVASLGVEGVLTSPNHRCGTERVAEVARLPRYAQMDMVLNVQGDEPFVAVEAAVGAVHRVRIGDPVGTAAAPLRAEDVAELHRVKVVVDRAGHALRFSRAFPASGAWPCEVQVMQHIGVYAYSKQALLRWAALRPVPEELEEGLEQLRPLAYGITVGVAEVGAPPLPGIDTEADLARAEAYMDSVSQRVG
ncbi:MAG: 3-deoxy-manno-octulosonate cytidylyltransferase [Gemmatimonadales bacterium]|nr:3-deoxy-manno-octulosonate cytidylyltransferase [Gemmatimonadales bacterium]NIN11631.1 3-deoxy-manno-octulosonate cytidylyltransferase [Gemmatimonadales bacterium]NIN50237.1 3-deoxy-manno-octulosonate cytidylyltransferase [Gemmatimonadales bacterium]NIP07701.1 3-deoxy-manno-octulosonate cytidylyltransferase [Gemmatimonadales bacterium]NIR01853.1 3-deoxy-manno-octulosonate cytidylyltransferase [Gemmatimonadales bacterium]